MKVLKLEINMDAENKDDFVNAIMELSPKELKEHITVSREILHPLDHASGWDPWGNEKGRFWSYKSTKVLYQYIERHHAESMLDRPISPEEWDRFLKRFQDTYAELASELAYECLQTWDWEEKENDDQKTL